MTVVEGGRDHRWQETGAQISRTIVETREQRYERVRALLDDYLSGMGTRQVVEQEAPTLDAHTEPPDTRVERQRRQLELRLQRLVAQGPVIATTNRVTMTARPTFPPRARAWDQGRKRLEEQLDEIVRRAPRYLPAPPPAPPDPTPAPKPRVKRAPRRNLEAEPFWSPTPILAFRAWNIEQFLVGVARPWKSPTYVAGCIVKGTERMDDKVPHTDGRCGQPPCGIYATKLAETIASWWALEDHTAFGLVALSGRVVEHETGYRAAEATALSVIVRVDNAFATFTGETAVAALFRNPWIAIERNEEWVGPSPGNRAHAIVANYLSDEKSRTRALEHATWAGN